MRDEGGTNEGSYGLQFDNEVISFTLIDLDRSGRLAVRVSECNPEGVSRTKFFLPSEVDAYQVEITNDLSFHMLDCPSSGTAPFLKLLIPCISERRGPHALVRCCVAVLRNLEVERINRHHLDRLMRLCRH